MGVPSYFHWLVTRFEDEILTSDFSPEIDNLYLDLNCAIHPAVKAPGVTRETMYSAVGEYMEKILKFAQPREMLFIAIDGVAPRAKMQQQRKRRFKSVQDKILVDKIKLQYGLEINDSDDFNMISPGTIFMEELSEYLQQWIGRLKKDSRYTNLTIVFSDSSHPGEGEHKIMDHVRTQTNNSTKIAVYGLDSDLIFLCLCNYRPNMVLVREKIHFGSKFKCAQQDEVEYVYLSIDHLRNCLLKILNPYVSLQELDNDKIFGNRHVDNFTKDSAIEKSFGRHTQEMLQMGFYTTEAEQHNLIMDYVFMSFILGNDFLPPPPSLKIREGGLDQLVRVYKVVQMNRKEYLVKETSGVNVPFLQDMLQHLSDLEEPMLQKQTKMRHYRIGRFTSNQDYQNANEYERAILEFEYVENQGKDLIQLGYDGWKERYYYHHFNIEQRNHFEFKNNINEICKNFFEGMMWTLRYYQYTCKNWDWTYSYHSSPAVSDLCESLNKIDPNKIHFPTTNPASPLEQLMTILPPGSSHLLPNPLKELMHEPESPIAYLYPREFELDILNNRYRWECHPLLPTVDPVLLRNAIQSKWKWMKKEDINRNKPRCK